MNRRHGGRARSVAALLAVGLVLTACGDDDARPSQPVVGGDPERGRDAIMQYGCASCHSVPGVGSVEGGVGPDLAGLVDRRYLGGHLPNRPENLVRWLRDPQAVAPGTVMPDMDVTEEDARDIAAYLYDQ